MGGDNGPDGVLHARATRTRHRPPRATGARRARPTRPRACGRRPCGGPQSLDAPMLGRIGALVRDIHDASVGLPIDEEWAVLLPADQPDLLCHHDLAAWNLVIDGDR